MDPFILFLALFKGGKMADEVYFFFWGAFIKAPQLQVAIVQVDLD